MKKQTGKHRRLTPFAWFLIRIILIGSTVWILSKHVIHIQRAQGNQMAPAVKDGDLCIFLKTGNYQVNDLIAYEDSDGRKRVGRIIAMEDDLDSYRIVMDDNNDGMVKKEHLYGKIIFLFRRRGFES